MKRVVSAVVGFLIGDDVWLAAAVLVLLAVTAALVRLDVVAWWVLPLGTPAAVRLSVQRVARGSR